MRIDDRDRPDEITCDEIWELYKLLEELDEHYVFYDSCDAPENREELYYLENITCKKQCQENIKLTLCKKVSPMRI